MNSKVETGKHDESNCIEETILRIYKFNLNVSSCRLLLAPYIGGQVSEFQLGAIQNLKTMSVYIVDFIFDS
jgi:hypothetical protein